MIQRDPEILYYIVVGLVIIVITGPILLLKCRKPRTIIVGPPTLMSSTVPLNNFCKAKEAGIQTESPYETPKACKVNEYVIAICETKLDHTYYNDPINKNLSTIKECNE